MQLEPEAIFVSGGSTLTFRGPPEFTDTLYQASAKVRRNPPFFSGPNREKNHGQLE